MSIIKATNRWDTAPARKENPGCPICGREMGHIGRHRYYCAECEKEVSFYAGIVKIFDIDKDGIAREVLA